MVSTYWLLSGSDSKLVRLKPQWTINIKSLSSFEAIWNRTSLKECKLIYYV